MFDSGVGGLTVARAVLDQLPHEQVLYIGDTANGPYGPRSINEIGFTNILSQAAAESWVHRESRQAHSART